MKFPVDLSLFEGIAHSPSFLALQRSMGRDDLRLLDFCVPVNPYFPTREMFAGFRAKLAMTLKYYPASGPPIAELIASRLGLDPEAVVPANGSTELITWVDRLFISDGLATPVPTFGRWTDQPRETGKRLFPFPTVGEEDFPLDVDRFADFVRATGARAAAICNPNNPTGDLVPPAEMVRLLDRLADLDLIVVDESFLDFSVVDPIPSMGSEAVRRPNVLVLKSLGKNFGMHGIRLGYGLTRPDRARALREALPHWNVNAVAEMVLRDLDGHMEEYEASRRRVIQDREDLEEALAKIEELRVFPSRANFVLIRVPREIEARDLRDRLLTRHGCLVRECGNKLGADPRDIRIAVRPPKQAARLLRALRHSLSSLADSACRAPARPAAMSRLTAFRAGA